ncbi:MAG: hypothetical protein AMXMBFR13_39990 [Phycisphaerae bacterium]
MSSIRTLVSIVVVLLASSAFAGPLATDAAGLPAFTGSANFASGALTAVMDYSVFAPGAYTGADPSGGSEYVYAYQVFNTSTSRNINGFSVGLLAGGGAHNESADAGYPMVGGVAPTFVSIGATSMAADFVAPEILTGGFSQVVILTSPLGPTFASASVQSGGLQAQNLAPTPIPEPTSLLLLGLMGLAMCPRWRPR